MATNLAGETNPKTPIRWIGIGAGVLFVVLSAWQAIQFINTPREPEIVASIIQIGGSVEFDDGIEAGYHHAPFQANEQ